jgi:hypothetical protein
VDRPEDLFDVFEPWTEPGVEAAVGPGARVPEPPSMRRPRKRIGPRIPPPAPLEEEEDQDQEEAAPDPARSPGAFIRKEGIPEIERMERRLGSAGHRLRVQDLLDLQEPALRVLFWPQPGPLRVEEGRTRATLEFVVRLGEDARVEATYWLADDPVRVDLGVVPVEKLDASWLRSRLLDFVEAILGRT